ncbi:MAG: flagellar biosynthetic protein FliP, partial [Acidobacteriota bacterium]|nr:flagellar biosynthetic protein FliP [Acidobacteriota bacterium]
MKTIFLLPIFSVPALAAPASSNLFNVSGSSLSAPMQIVLLLTALTVLPAAVMSVTPFLRIVIVLHFLRQALGTQSTPSNQVLIGLSLFLTILIMQPIA